MRIERVTEPDGTLVAAVARLLPQLTPEPVPPLDLARIATAPGTSLLVARDGEDVVGMLTLVVFDAPTGRRGQIEDVVVDE
jgi:hypothetical protein